MQELLERFGYHEAAPDDGGLVVGYEVAHGHGADAVVGEGEEAVVCDGIAQCGGSHGFLFRQPYLSVIFFAIVCAFYVLSTEGEERAKERTVSMLEGKSREEKYHTPSLNLGSPLRFINVGMLGPKTSVSNTPLRCPCRAKANARLTAMVDLPTPPLADETAITLLTSRMGRFSGRPR